MFKTEGTPICKVGDACRLGYKSRILVSLRVLMKNITILAVKVFFRVHLKK